MADLVSASAASAEGGWVILTCSATPNGTDAYTINANTSVGSQVNLFSLATTNWSRLLVTSGTKASGPAAGDSFLVYGNLTGAGTHTAFTVTVNTTSNINYGNVANTLVSPSIAVGQFGTLAFASSASTNYAMEFAGPAVIYNGGTFTVGTSGTPIPGTSTATLTLNCTTEGDTGLTVRNGGTYDTTGVARTSGKNFSQTHLGANIAAGAQTSLTVLDDTGWLSGDQIVLAATDQITNTPHSEPLTLTGPATSSTLPISATLSFPHLGQVISYTSINNGVAYSFPEQAEIILLTRNVKIQGATNTQPSYIYCGPTAACVMAWTEFQYISGNAPGQYGLESDTVPGGTFSLTNFSMHDSRQGALFLNEDQANWGGTTATPVLVQFGSFYHTAQVAGSALNFQPISFTFTTTNPNWVIDTITMIGADAGNFQVNIKNLAGQFSNIVFVDCINGAVGLSVTSPGPPTFGPSKLGNWGPLIFHSNGNFDTEWAATAITGTIHGIYVYHSYGWFWGGSNGSYVVDPYYSINGLSGAKGNVDATYRNGFVANDTDAPGTGFAGWFSDENSNVVRSENMEYCPTSAQSTSVGNIFIGCSQTLSPVEDAGGNSDWAGLRMVGRNSPFLGTNDLTWGMNGQGLLSSGSYAETDWGNNHRTWLTNGWITNDTAIFHTVPYSTRLTPFIIAVTGYISGTTLTVVASPPPFPPPCSLGPNLPVQGPGVASNTTVIYGGVVICGAGDHTVNVSQTAGSVGSPIVITGPLGRLPSAPQDQGVKIAVAAGRTVQACVWVRLSDAGDASGVNYAGDAPRLIERTNPQMGINSDTVLATFSGSTTAVWQQLCGTTGVAPQDGVFELVVDADMTPAAYTAYSGTNPIGWINVADWSTTN